MSKENPFVGYGIDAQLSKITYDLFMTKDWVSYTTVMETYTKNHGDEPWTPEKGPISCWNKTYYNALKKAFPSVCNLIMDKCGKESIEEDGNNRNKRYKYVGKEENPLKDMLHAKAISDLNFYWQFCQDSAGFFPSVWLEDFLKDSIDLLHIQTKKQKGEQIISTGMDRALNNIEYLPFLYKAITYEWVLKFEFHPFGEEPFELILHPQHLKEFNGRWFVFGKAEGKDTPVFNVALDRITSKPSIVHQIKYQPAKKGFYKKYFDDIVGVTHKGNPELEEVVIHTKSNYIHGLMVTKPIHSTQKENLPFAKHGQEEYGEISLKVRPNKELIGKILTYGEFLEVVSPLCLRNEIIDILKKQLNAYLQPES